MEEKIKKEKIEELSNKYTYWTSNQINQFGLANNFFLTICLGFLAFAMDKEYLESFSIHGEFSYKMMFTITLLFLLIFSLFFGIISMLSRLYDFRITRNIILTKKRYLNTHNEEIELAKLDDKERNVFNTSFKVIFGKYKPLNKEFVNNLKDSTEYKNIFHNQRQIANDLGINSWNMFQAQIIFLFLSIITYSIILLN